jgi:hypothetical protein
VTRSVPWRSPVWTDTPLARIRFVHELRGCGVTAHIVHPGLRQGALLIDMRVTAVELPERRVRMIFARGADAPRVYADGPSESPHRYADSSLCMWKPTDAPDRRWTRDDGARALLGHIAAHLIREHWWRLTGEWPGDEAPHGPNNANPEPSRGAV